MLIRIQTLKKKYDKNVLFSDFDSIINENDIVGIYGDNGSGKTTLLDLIAKKITPSFGKISYEPQNMSVSYFEQISEEEIIEMNKSHLSSGEKVKQQLEDVIKSNANIYIFDEPTNHLDVDSIKIFAEKIKKLNGIKIIASHNKDFLKMCSNKIWNIEDGKISIYKGNFDHFLSQKAEITFKTEDYYNKIIRKVTDLRLSDMKRQDKFSMMRKGKKADPVKFFRKKNKFLHQNSVYKNRIKRLMKEELPKLPKEKQQLLIDFINSPIEELFLAQINKISKKFNKKYLFKEIDFEIIPQEKILISGKNGAGKTTLLKIIAGLERDFEGSVEFSPMLDLQYFKQENFDDLTYSNTLREELIKFILREQLIAQNLDSSIEKINVLYPLNNIHDDQLMEHLEKLGFTIKNLDQQINDFSEGEKIKIRFSKILLLEPNLLLLDEPTNHLDLVNKKGIIEAIKRYNGSLVVVTHDPELISAIEWNFHLEL